MTAGTEASLGGHETYVADALDGLLHKGDGGNGLFLQFTTDTLQDALIPDEAGDGGLLAHLRGARGGAGPR